MTEPMHKTCTTCGETKPLNGFHKDKYKKDGLRPQCKPCTNEYKRRWGEANREKRQEYNHRYREANLEKFRERQRSWSEANREKVAEYKRHYNEDNREIVNAKNLKNMSEKQNLTKTFATTPLYTRYLPGEDALILADNGMTMYQKAVELGRTYRSVRHRRHALLTKLSA